MKLVTFTQGNKTRIGLLKGDGIIDLSKADSSLPGDMLAFIQAGESALNAAKAAESADAHYTLADVNLEAVISRPPKIIGIGLNYRAHAEESGMELPKVPLVFTKQSTSANGPFDPIYWSEDSKALDYEGELGVIIGKNCRRVPAGRASEVIFGLCVLNDVSVRDWQTRGTPPSFTMGKSWDSHSPIGPAITIDPSLDMHNLQLTTHVNGELRQNTSTDDLIFNTFELIEFLSTAFTLEAGDIIATGTPSGVGMAMKPRSMLKPGDTVKVEIEGLGYIENEVIVEPADAGHFM